MPATSASTAMTGYGSKSSPSPEMPEKINQIPRTVIPMFRVNVMAIGVSCLHPHYKKRDEGSNTGFEIMVQLKAGTEGWQEAIDPQQSRVVELRFFGGFTMDETAEVMHISPATVGREWTLARAWLYAELPRKLS